MTIRCPDCVATLPGDGSCCDRCGWTWHGGGDDERCPSNRTTEEISEEVDRRALTRAIAILSRSPTGRNAMRHLLTWLDDDGLSLDHAGQNAIRAIELIARGRLAGTARDMMRAALAR